MSRDLRNFVAAYECAHPAGVVRIAEPVALEHVVADPPFRERLGTGDGVNLKAPPHV